MEYDHYHFSGHAIQRMFERGITKDEVIEVLRHGEIIEEYPNDFPFPSCLMLDVINGRPLHVVAAMDAKTKTCYIVTIYDPHSDKWYPDFKIRRLK